MELFPCGIGGRRSIFCYLYTSLGLTMKLLARCWDHLTYVKDSEFLISTDSCFESGGNLKYRSWLLLFKGSLLFVLV